MTNSDGLGHERKKTLSKQQQLADGIRDAAYQKRGITLIRLMRLKESFFCGLLNDCARIAADQDPSDVSSPAHGTNWTKPSGTVMQWALFGPEGTKGRSIRTPQSVFVASGDFLKQLCEWIRPSVASFRLNLIGGLSSLHPHREQVVIPGTDAGKYAVRVRFHLPMITSEECRVQLNSQLYHLERGTLYYFNNGAVHGAVNHGSTNRMHLVWDAVLDKRVYDQYFNPQSPPSFAEDATSADVVPVGSVPIPNDFPSEPDLVDYAGALVQVR